MLSRRRQILGRTRFLAPGILWLTLSCAEAPEPEQPEGTAEAAQAAFVVPETEAGSVLASAMAEAAATDRLLFVHSGAEWCGWCRRLEAWLVRDDMAPIFTEDFVDVKIDLVEMEGGKELMDALGAGMGVPWLVILRPDGSAVINSDHPERGNIGSPIAEWEIEHWNVMMRAAAKRITEDEILYMAKTLAEDR